MKVLLVIAQEGFRDEEFLYPKSILDSEGYEVVTASPEGGTCKGMLGAEVEADIKISDADPDDYAAVVIVGGTGSPKQLWDDQRLHEIVRSVYGSGNHVASICLSGGVLAKAGVLKGKKATAFERPDAVEAVREAGGHYLQQDLVVDGRIITARGPEVAKEFAERVAQELSKR